MMVFWEREGQSKQQPDLTEQRYFQKKSSEKMAWIAWGLRSSYVFSQGEEGRQREDFR